MIQLQKQMFEENDKYKGTRFDKNTNKMIQLKKALTKGFNQDQGNQLEDGRISKAFMERYLLVELILSVLAILSIGITCLENVTEFNLVDDHQQVEMLCVVGQIISLFMILITILRYYTMNQLLVSKNELHKVDSSLLIKKNFRPMFIEILLLIPTPTYLFINSKIEFEIVRDPGVIYYYKLNEILNFCVLLRIYIIGRFILLTSEFYSNRSRRICKIFDLRANYTLALKCLFKRSPYLVLTVFIVIGLFIFANMIKIAERHYFQFIISPVSRPLSFKFNISIWLCWITMTTIGYGDFFPVTLFGRLIVVLISLYGISIISILVSVFHNDLSLNSLENNVYITLERLQKRDEIKHEAGQTISNFFYFISQRLYQKDRIQIIQNDDLDTLRNMKQNILNWKKAKSEYRVIREDQFDLDNELNRYFWGFEDIITEGQNSHNNLIEDIRIQVDSYLERQKNLKKAEINTSFI